MSQMWTLLSVPILACISLRWYLRRGKTCPPSDRMEGRTFVITGANSGIGEATAFELARRGGRVIMACRDFIKAEPVMKKIVRETGNPNVKIMIVDLSSQKSIKEFALKFIEAEDRLDVLVNNAAYEGPKMYTEEGIEQTFAVNHVGHFLLTILLLPKLRTSTPSRIINVTSDIYEYGILDLDNLENDSYPDIYMAYARSKLANVYFTTELNKRFANKGITSYAVHPGVVSTNLFRKFPGILGTVLPFFSKLFFKTPHQGCQSVVYCAVTNEIEKHSGKFFTNCEPVKFAKNVRNAISDGIGKNLWEVSEKLCHIQSPRIHQVSPVVSADCQHDDVIAGNFRRQDCLLDEKKIRCKIKVNEERKPFVEVRWQP